MLVLQSAIQFDSCTILFTCNDVMKRRCVCGANQTAAPVGGGNLSLVDEDEDPTRRENNMKPEGTKLLFVGISMRVQDLRLAALD